MTIRPINHRTLKLKSKNYRNWEANKKMATHIENKFGCQIYDETGVTQLSDTPTPQSPKHHIQKITFPQWVKTLLKNSLGQLTP